jgi:hypothetical protein
MEVEGLGDLPELLNRPPLKIRQREQGIHALEQHVTVRPIELKISRRHMRADLRL